MSIRSRAVAAHESTQSDRVAEALAAVTDVIGVQPAGEPQLQVEDMVVSPAVTLAVFTDGDVHIATRDRGQGFADVRLVEHKDGRWTDGPVVESLASLGKVLPDFDPVDENAAPQPWAEGLNVTVGERYTYNGSIYEVLVAHTTSLADAPDKNKNYWAQVAA